VVSFASPIEALSDPWSIGLSATLSELMADAPDPVFSAVSAERTTQAVLQTSLTIPLPNQASMRLSASYARSVSNYGLYNFDDFGAAVAFSKGF
jgi:hypothetical protein